MLCFIYRPYPFLIVFFFNDTATTEIYTLSLHDALPILAPNWFRLKGDCFWLAALKKFRASRDWWRRNSKADRKSTRLNSSHGYISYAVFCLKKKIHDKIYARTPHPKRSWHA